MSTVSTVSTPNTSTPDLRQQLDSLQAELASRTSIYHFAHTGVAMVASLIVAGAAAKLGWDSYRLAWWGWGVSLLAVLLWGYALLHYRRGMRHLRSELERFEKVKELRRALHLEDPSELLPQ